MASLTPTHRRGTPPEPDMPAPAGEAWSPSPDPYGRRVVCVSDRDGAPRAWVHAVAAASSPYVEPLLLDTGPDPVLEVAWAPTGDWIACVLAPGGAPRTDVWVIRPDGSGLRRVAGTADTTAVLTGWTDDGWLMITETDAASRAVLLAPATGQRRVLVSDDLLTLLDVAPGGGHALLRRGPRGARWLELLDTATGARRTLLPDADQGRFAADGTSVYARTDLGDELAGLVEVGLDGAEPVVLVRRPDAELEEFALTADRRTAALLWNRYGGISELTLLELASREQRPVPSAGDVYERPVFSADGGLLCFTAQDPVRPRAVWAFDLGTSDVAPVDRAGAVAAGAALASVAMAGVAPQLCDVRAGDGLTITGWLYRPAGEGPWPTVISLHSGPESQERPGYNPLFQELVAAGMAVFAPNVRGSSGFGRAFMAADNLAGRYGAIADVGACAQYLLETGVAAPGRLACLGRSYGGYLTMAALVTFPELFAAGVSECGMSNFETFYARTEPWIASAAVSKYGCPDRDRDLLRDLSPLHHLDRLSAALLLVHGANDTNVPVYESQQVVDALRDGDVPHAFLLIDGEGHDFLSPARRAIARTATVGWLTSYLGLPEPGRPPAAVRSVAPPVAVSPAAPVAV
jgi:dipeptidyl aminopeptidase/acylaminoacyl peptidase